MKAIGTFRFTSKAGRPIVADIYYSDELSYSVRTDLNPPQIDVSLSFPISLETNKFNVKFIIAQQMCKLYFGYFKADLYTPTQWRLPLTSIINYSAPTYKEPFDSFVTKLCRFLAQKIG